MTDPAPPFPPLRTCGCVALIDDDDLFLQTLEELLASDHYQVKCFTQPKALDRFLTPKLSALDEEQTRLAAIWRAQAETQGTVALEALRFFRNADRSSVPMVLVSDYAMPTDTGVSVCARYPHLGLQRILLTGVADNSVAVNAFNAGAIEQFVQKQGALFPGSIVKAVQTQTMVSALRRGFQLASRLPKDLTSALSQPDAAQALNALLREHGIREYLVLGEPQGLLGITSDLQAVWVQLETERSLQELMDVLDLAQVSPSSRERAERRESLIAVEWMQQLNAPVSEQPARVLSREPLLLAAVFPLQLPADLMPVAPRDN